MPAWRGARRCWRSTGARACAAQRGGARARERVSVCSSDARQQRRRPPLRHRSTACKRVRKAARRSRSPASRRRPRHARGHVTPRDAAPAPACSDAARLALLPPSRPPPQLRQRQRAPDRAAHPGEAAAGRHVSIVSNHRLPLLAAACSSPLQTRTCCRPLKTTLPLTIASQAHLLRPVPLLRAWGSAGSCRPPQPPPHTHTPPGASPTPRTSTCTTASCQRASRSS